MTDVQCNRPLLKDVVHYICASVPADCLGKTKLYKCFYYFDMFHHAVHGHPAIGLEYVRAPNGPISRQVDDALRSLKSEGALSFGLVDYHGLAKWQFKTIGPAPAPALSVAQKSLLDDITDWVCHHNTAKSISEFSHNLAWQGVENGEVIPYRTAMLIFPQEPSDEALEWANQMADEIEESPFGHVGYTDEPAFRACVFRGYLH